jgi:hypothetical protein
MINFVPIIDAAGDSAKWPPNRTVVAESRASMQLFRRSATDTTVWPISLATVKYRI